MSDKHEVENLMRSTMENLRDMIDVNTVIGDTVETSDGTCIIPISKVSEDQYPFGGGSGAGVSVKPVAFLIIREDTVRLLPVNYDTTVDRIVDSVPQVLDIVKSFFKDKNSHNNNVAE